MDVATGKTTLLRGDLRSYDGVFRPRMSPAGDYFAYSLWEKAENGIFTLPTAGGEHAAVAQNGDEHHFYPEWSPTAVVANRIFYLAESSFEDRSARVKVIEVEP